MADSTTGTKQEWPTPRVVCASPGRSEVSCDVGWSPLAAGGAGGTALGTVSEMNVSELTRTGFTQWPPRSFDGDSSAGSASGTMLISPGRGSTVLPESSCPVEVPAGALSPAKRGGALARVRRSLARTPEVGGPNGPHGAVVDFGDLFPWWKFGTGSDAAAAGGDGCADKQARKSSRVRRQLGRLGLFRKPEGGESAVVDAKDLFPWWGPGPGESEGKGGGEGQSGNADGATSGARLWARVIGMALSGIGWMLFWRGGDRQEEEGMASPRAPCCVGRRGGAGGQTAVPLELREDHQVGHPRLEFCAEGGPAGSGVSASSGGSGRGRRGAEERGRPVDSKHNLAFTPLFVTAVVTVFAFMAGLYPVYELQKLHDVRSARSADIIADEHWRPNDLSDWLKSGQTFPFEFLVRWGGRYSPKLNEGQWWRWFTSPFIHQGFQHLLGNMVLLGALAGHLERNYGAGRVALMFVLSSVGGNIMSAAFEDGCILVLGASGAVFGFMGFFAADSVLNFDTVRRPLLRIGIIFTFLAFFVVTVFNAKDGTTVSHFSHFGGLLVGLFPPFLFMPNMQQWKRKMVSRLPVSAPDTSDISADLCNGSAASGASRPPPSRSLRCELTTRSWYSIRVCAFIGVLVLLLLFVVLPVYLYAHKLFNTVCLLQHNTVDGDIRTTSTALGGFA